MWQKERRRKRRGQISLRETFLQTPTSPEGLQWRRSCREYVQRASERNERLWLSLWSKWVYVDHRSTWISFSLRMEATQWRAPLSKGSESGTQELCGGGQELQALGTSSIPVARGWVTRDSDHRPSKWKGMGDPEEQKWKGKSPAKRIHFPSLWQRGLKRYATSQCRVLTVKTRTFWHEPCLHLERVKQRVWNSNHWTSGVREKDSDKW